MNKPTLGEYIRDNSEVILSGRYPYDNSVELGTGSIVRTSKFIVPVFIGVLFANSTFYLDLDNGNLLETCIRDGYARAESNVLYLYNYVVGISITSQDLKYYYEKWCSSGSSSDYFDFLEMNYFSSGNMSVSASYVLNVETKRKSIIKNILCGKRSNHIFGGQTQSKFVTDLVGRRLYRLLRIVGQDYLLIYLKNSPASMIKITQALGLDKLEDQDLVQNGVKEFIYNIPLSEVTKTDSPMEKINEMLLDLGAISNRYKEG